MDIRCVDSIKVNGENVGNRVRVKVIRTRLPTFKVAEFDIMYGQGILKKLLPLTWLLIP